MPKQMSYDGPSMSLPSSYWVLEQINSNFHIGTGGGKFVFLCYASKLDYDAGKQHIDSHTIQTTMAETVSLLSAADAVKFQTALTDIFATGYQLCTLKRTLKAGYTFDGTNYRNVGGTIVPSNEATTTFFDTAVDVQ